LPRRPTRDQFFPDYRADAVVVGIRGRWTIWAGGHRRQIQGRRPSGRQRGARARCARTIDAAVISAWTGLKTAQRAVEAGKARSAAADEALRSCRLEAKVGAKPTLAVLDADARGQRSRSGRHRGRRANA
jgi:outer membrane protein